jgi:GDSL-like Lipase/Acylhydrolase family
LTRTFWTRSSRSIFAVVAVSTAALVVAVVATFIVVTQSSHSQAGSTVVDHLSGRRGNAAGDATPASSRSAVYDALFVGASYTAGLGATPPTAGYAYLIGREPGWHAQIDGVSGTGFLNPGPRGNQTFADRITGLTANPHPDLVIFQGGRNDVGYSAARLRAAIIATVDITRRRFVGAQIVLLGPIPARVPTPRGQLLVESVLRSAASACHATFIDPIAQHWITVNNEQGYTGHVPAHPDNLGYAYIAARLLPELAAVINERRGS